MVSRVFFSTALCLMATAVRASQLRGLEEATGNETLVDDVFEIPDDFRDGEESRKTAKTPFKHLAWS